MDMATIIFELNHFLLKWNMYSSHFVIGSALISGISNVSSIPFCDLVQRLDYDWRFINTDWNIKLSLLHPREVSTWRIRSEIVAAQ